MKNIWNLSWNEWVGLGWHHGKYILVMVIFTVFVFYNVAVVSKELPKKSKSSFVQSQPADRIEWDLTPEEPEKVFGGMLQALSGDWYRIGFSTIANRATRLDAVLTAVSGTDVLIESFDIADGDSYQYHEMLFQVPTGRFSDVKLILRSEAAPESWSYAGVKISEFSLSRLNVRNKFEADGLMPTIAGTVEHKLRMLELSNLSKSNIVFEGVFRADDDFIESIRLNAQEKLKNNTYLLEIHEKSEGKDVSLKKIILKPGDIYAESDEWGNQSIALPIRLTRGKEYSIVLKGTGDVSKNITLSPLEGLGGIESLSNNDESVVAVAFGQYAAMNGVVMLSGAKVEDFGDEILYTYTLRGEVNDLFDVFDTEGNVKFDAKKDLVIGEQKQNTSFTYRFFTVYPFRQLVLDARQSGDSEKEVKLEYSFDNEFWREVPATQVSGEPQIFSLVLVGTGIQDIIYVRVSYNGEDKKTGSFGLDQLSVRAKLIRK